MSLEIFYYHYAYYSLYVQNDSADRWNFSLSSLLVPCYPCSNPFTQLAPVECGPYSDVLWYCAGHLLLLLLLVLCCQ